MEKQNLDKLVADAVAGLGRTAQYKEGCHQDIETIMESGEEKEIKQKNLQDIVKEVAQEEGMTEEEVMKHLQAVSKMMNSGYGVPKFKNNKQKAKDKSKRKQAKKSRKRNR